MPLLNASNGSAGLRSVDGGQLYVGASGALAIADALDGRVQRLIGLPAGWRLGSGGLTPASVSADGHWLVLADAGSTTNLLLVDLDRGSVAASGPMTPGQPQGSTPLAGSGPLALPGGQVLVLPPGGKEAVLLAPHGQRLEIEARLADQKLSCYSPAATVLHALPNGSAVVGYCPYDGRVWWLDLPHLRLAGSVETRIGNPFWGAPAFSPDGRLLYVYDSWGGRVNVIDLIQRRLLNSRSATEVAKAAFQLPFVQDAYAKGPNFSAALAADGGILFVTGSQGTAAGIYALDTGTWSVKAHWLDGRSPQAIWAGLVGLEVYALEQDGSLEIINPLAGSTRTVSLGGQADFTVP